MRVLISYLFCTKGGVETALYNRLKNIDRNQLEVDLHFFRDYGGCSLFEDFSGRVIIQQDDTLVQKEIEEKSYDIVISIDSVDMLRILQKMNYQGRIGLEVHTTYEKSLQYLQESLINIVDFIIVPSRYQKSLVRGKVDNKKIYILGNAVNECITYCDCNYLKYDKKIILWVGRIDQHKNWRLFLRIAKELYKKNRNYIFWVVGGLKSDQSEINAFENLIYELGIECVVRWIPQVLYTCISEIYSVVANSGGCYISTSTNESFGMTIIEAMACRCPVIVNKVGALPELVCNGRGLCVENMDDSEQIQKIYEFIESTNKEEMIKKSSEYVMEQFSSDIIGKKFIGIMEKTGGGYKDERHKICIFGSCCTRDVFEYDEYDQFLLSTYIARQSIISSIDKAVPISMSEIALDSSFQQKQVYSDFNKTAFDQMKKFDDSWLIIDLVDERFDLLKIGDGIVTNSDLLQSMRNYDDKKMIVKKVKETSYFIVNNIKIDSMIKQWCEKVLEIYPPARIIIHKVYCANKYINYLGQIKEFNSSMLQYIEATNELYKYMYNCMECELNGCYVIDSSAGIIADQGHKWGLEPFHFQEEYYKKILTEILVIMNTDTEEIC